MRRNLKKWVSMLLTIAMLITLIPVSAAAADDATSFYRIFHLDAGRKYFSVDQIKNIIDSLAAKNYTHLELAVGNDGLRFLLNDMSVTANDTTYVSDDVKAGIQAGNKTYYDAGTNELTQAEMDAIIKYAQEKGIEIIPLINTPGHMDAILDCMEKVGISNPAYSGSARTVDVTNTAAVNFTVALVDKYIQYFAGQGCRIFNMGCDEYANDVSNSGFAGLISKGNYGAFVTYVNSLAKRVENANMTPMAFNDGIYYDSNMSGGTFDSDIMIAYWTSGWGGYSPASASFLAGKGHKIINTNDAWYYVLGRTSGDTRGYTIATAQNGVQSTACTDVPGNDDSTAAGCMICLWCDTPSASYSDTEVDNVTGLIDTFAESNPNYFTIGTDTPDPTDPIKPTDPVAVTKNETVTVTVGGTVTATIEGEDYSNNIVETELNESIATVSAEYAQTQGGTEEVKATSITSGSSYYIKNSSGQYLSSNGTWVSDIKSAALWTATTGRYGGYNLKSGDYYLYYNGYRLTTSRNYATEWSFDKGTFSYEFWSGEYTLGDAYTVTTTDPINGTIVTFTGVSAGTTYVTVGNTRYTINVVAEDLSKVTPLTVEYWITNLPVTAGGATSQTISAQSAYGESGVEISTLVPETGAYAYGSVVYWKGTVLDANNKQTSASGAENDKTGSGKDFSKIRYYNGNWQYYYEADGTWNTISNSDQVVIYWLQPTEVTKEITTLVKDWGYSPSDQQGDNNNKVALTVAVVYPDGTVSPTEGNMYSTSTTLFNYWTNRDIGLVAPVNNSDYEISKITVTSGKRDQSGTGQWGSSDTITWDKITNEAGEQWYDETTYWEEADGGTPMVNGVTSNITWSNYNTAKLVLIYLKPVHYDTNLLVKWVDDSVGGTEISSMEVAVSSDVTETTFYNGLKQTSALPAEGVGGTFTLDDNAYVTNSSNVNQTFNKNISTVPGVAAQYKSGLYKYISADLSADGKTLTLHYNIDSGKLSLNYIVDFGLSINVPLSDLVDQPNDVNSVEIVGGTATVNDDKSITYKPGKVMSGTETVRVKVSYETTSQIIAIGFTPATTVYYEENYATFEKGTQTGNSRNTTQTASKVGTQARYGYDAAYADDGVQASNGTYVTLGDGSNGEFTFTGTGVDIYANSTPYTGKMMVYLYKGDTLKGLYTVDTKMANGVTELTESQAVTGYNIPVVAIKDLDLGTYKVKMEVVKTKVTASDGTISKEVRPVNIDGFRVYNTMGNDETAQNIYNEDCEDNPSFFEVRDLALSLVDLKDYSGQYGSEENIVSQVFDKVSVTANGAEATGAILNGNNSYTKNKLQDLIDNGPKNEVYLYQNQTIVLNVSTIRDIQVGLKALNAATTYVVNNGETQDLNTSTDMFYTVKQSADNTITITNTGAGILSVTLLKICDAPSDAIQPITEENVKDALMNLGYIEPEAELADATANINLIDYTGATIATTALTVNGESGQEAVFSADAIKAAVEDALPDGYAIAYESQIANQTVVCGESTDVNVQIGKVATLQVTYKKLFGKTVGTATLTGVQTSAGSSYSFSASEIMKAAPKGYWSIKLLGTKVKYGSTSNLTVQVL